MNNIRYLTLLVRKNHYIKFHTGTAQMTNTVTPSFFRKTASGRENTWAATLNVWWPSWRSGSRSWWVSSPKNRMKSSNMFSRSSVSTAITWRWASRWSSQAYSPWRSHTCLCLYRWEKTAVSQKDSLCFQTWSNRTLRCFSHSTPHNFANVRCVSKHSHLKIYTSLKYKVNSLKSNFCTAPHLSHSFSIIRHDVVFVPLFSRRTLNLTMIQTSGSDEMNSSHNKPHYAIHS